MMGLGQHIRRLRSDDEGGLLVEYGLVIGLLLFLLFGLIDFARMGYSYVMAQKAAELAVREAVVRQPACSGLPQTNVRGILTGTTDELEFGASCSIDASLCADVGTVSCTAANQTATSAMIWARIAPLMPSNATPENIEFTYKFDPNLGFLGGPYVPLVTVEIINLDFEFVTPLGALASLAGASDSGDVGNDFNFPSMSVSLPSEALGRL